MATISEDAAICFVSLLEGCLLPEQMHLLLACFCPWSPMKPAGASDLPAFKGSGLEAR